MIAGGTLALLLAAGIGGGGRTGGPSPSGEQIELAQVTIHERIVVRVPASRVPPVVRWKFKRAPRCIPADGLAGAAFMAPDSIDLIARGGDRTRADLASMCPAIDFYTGFYLTPSTDRRICAGRDSIHTRAGGECQIKRFRRLVPEDPPRIPLP